MLGSTAEHAGVRRLAHEPDDPRPEGPGDLLQTRGRADEIRTAKVADTLRRPARGIRQPDAVRKQLELLLRREEPRREVRSVQEAPEVVPRVRESSSRGRARPSGIDPTEDDADARPEDVRNGRLGQTLSGSRVSIRSSSRRRSFSPISDGS